ncbi:hypothetical protein NPIL_528961 [Nephila pilipes]|uniref:Uncharacterized protein n=1 Tax=Nephila pilipes TaxID=299642 RepID=A0A8X6NJ95_NEPPI|nr:hypothetical protein NPIL_528961 [Nephila pilipes]
MLKGGGRTKRQQRCCSSQNSDDTQSIAVLLFTSTRPDELHSAIVRLEILLKGEMVGIRERIAEGESSLYRPPVEVNGVLCDGVKE